MKGAQKERVREFIQLTQTGEKTALFCLAHFEWKLDQALDAYFANPEAFYREPRPTIDRRKLEATYNRFKGRKKPNLSS